MNDFLTTDACFEITLEGYQCKNCFETSLETFSNYIILIGEREKQFGF